MTRPAENAGLAGIPIVTIAAVTGASPELVAGVASVCLAAPRVVTWIVDHGGLRGVRDLILNGHRRT